MHARHGTIHWRLVAWLCVGSVPGALVGTGIVHRLNDTPGLQHWLDIAIGAALSLAVGSMLVKQLVNGRRTRTIADTTAAPLAIRIGPTVAIGLIGGIAVGMTSVGSGSLMLVLVLFAYPALTAGKLVGTDLAQAIPLIGVATVGHLFLGDVAFGVAGGLLIGAIPGIHLGARLAAHAPDRVIRQALMIVLGASALKLFGTPTPVVGVGLAVTLAGWAVFRALAWKRSRATRSFAQGEAR